MSFPLFFSRHDSGGSIFQRRMDYSSFNVLPKHKINSYHIKVRTCTYAVEDFISHFELFFSFSPLDGGRV